MNDQHHTINPHNWVKNYADYLYAFTIVRINDGELAKDLVQETFLAALEKAGNFEGKSSERTWLTAILKNKIFDVYRKRSSGLNNGYRKEAEREQLAFFDEHDGHWNPEHRPAHFGIEQQNPLQQKEFEGVMQQCLEKLPQLWLAVFTMKHMEDAGSELICTELKLSQSNFWVIIHRAKLSLRACLQKNWI